MVYRFLIYPFDQIFAEGDVCDVGVRPSEVRQGSQLVAVEDEGMEVSLERLEVLNQNIHRTQLEWIKIINSLITVSVLYVFFDFFA